MLLLFFVVVTINCSLSETDLLAPQSDLFTVNQPITLEH